MNSKKNVLIVLLALSTVASGVLAWQQYNRANHAAAAESDNDELLKKLAAAERRAADLEARLAALEASPFSGESTPPPAPSGETPRPPADRPPGPGNRRGGAMAAWMNNPEVVQLMTEQQKSMLDNRYAALFKELNLTPAQLDAFKNLLIEKQNVQRDVMMAANESGLNPRENREELNKLIAEARAETDAAIAAAIGQDKFNQYQNFEATTGQRFMVEQISRTMSYAATPLSESQSRALVQIFSQANAQTTMPARSVGLGGPGPMAGAGPVEITDAMIDQASTILSPDQLRVLREQQANQQNARRLNQLMRENRQRN